MKSFVNLKARIKKLDEEIEYLRVIIENSPEGKLIVRHDKNIGTGYRYCQKLTLPDGSVKEKYLGKKDMEKVFRIANKMYFQKKLLDLQEERRLLYKNVIFRIKKTRAEEFLESHQAFQHLLTDSPLLLGGKALEWKKAPYRRNPKYPEGLIYPTIVPGLKVRSKAEADIVSRLEYYGVPYHYEEIKTINGIDYAMDFTCLNVQSDKTWYWDHRGMADHPDYIRKTIACENAFMNAGIIQGINLIVTTETKDHPLDLQWVDELIQYYLL